ncbi:MAG: hypothetical protein HOI06_06170 [Pelagibacteraceae bacterium]|jgi:hypothetical protein|nr:hypothetical protein [Pelagibacteraceae bacterium]
MTEKNKEIDLSQILNRLGIGLHALGFIGSLINLIAGIVLENLFFIFVSSPMALLIGWGLRWILSGERTNIIPFYGSVKKPFFYESIKKPLSSEKILNTLGIWLHYYFFLAGVVLFFFNPFYFSFFSTVNLVFLFIDLLFGWSFRWILSGENAHFIPFYKEPKIVKERSRKKRLGIGLHFGGFISSFLILFLSLSDPILFFLSPIPLLIGWKLRQMLSGEDLPIIPFNKKLGIGVHIYYYIIAVLGLIENIILFIADGISYGFDMLILLEIIFLVTLSLLIGWGLRSVLCGEKTKMITFYKMPMELHAFFSSLLQKAQRK